MSERKTDLLVSFEADVRFFGKDDVQRIKVEKVPCTWLWDEMTRETAEYWACVDWLQNLNDYDWFSVTCWSGSPVMQRKACA